MALFKRGDVWYFELLYGGRPYVKSTRVKNQGRGSRLNEVWQF